jgi:hypothetical protein
VKLWTKCVRQKTIQSLGRKENYDVICNDDVSFFVSAFGGVRACGKLVRTWTGNHKFDFHFPRVVFGCVCLLHHLSSFEK